MYTEAINKESKKTTTFDPKPKPTQKILRQKTKVESHPEPPPKSTKLWDPVEELKC